MLNTGRLRIYSRRKEVLSFQTVEAFSASLRFRNQYLANAQLKTPSHGY